MNEWRERLLAAVSPLDSGVSPLKVVGYRPPDQENDRPARTAAVLVALIDQPQPELVLTRRADHLPSHPGQVSFPGGAAEQGDASAVHTALREASEEISLPPERVTPIGFLDRLDTISDYRVLPVVGLVEPPVRLVPDQSEVAEVFTVPLEVAMDQSLYEVTVIRRQGMRYKMWTLNWQGQKIWGATAAMIMNLASRMERYPDF